ncbi:hypothetical protein GpartN1_g184.t1 [Galdieria partita]|uniref:Uncharacterized protein n=1 Tax=Galdieria partita TaxID=83374 RepID=A0A9C7UM98_9RHOD|nr:hypothetical protein GpartN1_g184.t1 [Galdieria partita]
MSGCLRSEVEWKPSVNYSRSCLEKNFASLNSWQTPIEGKYSQALLGRSESSNKLKVIEELSTQIRGLQTKLEKAYEEIERLKRFRNGSDGSEPVKNKMTELFSRGIGYRSVSERYVAQRRKNELTRKRSFPNMCYSNSEGNLQSLQVAENWKQSSYQSLTRNGSAELLEKDNDSLRSTLKKNKGHIIVSSDTVNRKSSRIHDSFPSSFNPFDLKDSVASISELSDPLPICEPRMEKLEFHESCFHAPSASGLPVNSHLDNEKDWIWNGNTFSDSTSLDEVVDSPFEGMRRDSFTYSDLSAAECFSDDVDSLSLGSILDDVAIDADEPIWSFGHLCSDWQL